MKKKDAFYFPHDSNAKDDPKVVMMIESLGVESYGIYWILIETLRDQPDYKYPFALIPTIARRYNTTADKVKAVITLYGLFEYDETGFFLSRSLVNRMIPMEQKRAKNAIAGKISAEKRRVKTLEIEHKTNECSTSVEHVSNECSTKRKEKKREEKKKEYNDNFQKRIEPHDVYVRIWNEIFGSSTIVSEGMIRECANRFRGLNAKIVSDTVMKYRDALEGDWSWIETRVDAFGFLTDNKYGFNWFINATPEMLTKKKKGGSAAKPVSGGNFFDQFDFGGDNGSV